MNSKKYTLVFTIIFAVISSIVVSVNYFVDPYLMTGAARISNFNKRKVEINNNVRLSKAYHPLQQSHDALLVGNSRIEMGLTPTHICFSAVDQRVYNLGLPGASVSNQLAYANNIIMQQPIRQVYLSLDFSDFTMVSEKLPISNSAKEEASAKSLKYLPNGSLNPNYRRSQLLDYYQALYSLSSLMSSLKTVLLQNVVSADRDDNGFNPANDFSRATYYEGPGALFEQKILSLRKKYNIPQYIRYSNGELTSTFSQLAEFLKLSLGRNIRVTLFTNPFHTQYWELIRSHGMQEIYEDWLNSLTELVQKLDDSRIKLWDFSSDSEFIHEAIPAPGIRAEPLRWFWEASHYRKELGDLMIDSMLADSCGTDIAFGAQRYP